MAVEIEYVVVRNGEKKMTFASKKEAEAWDKTLDMAEALSDWLGDSPLALDDAQCESLGLYFAENKEVLQHILRAGRLPSPAADAAAASDKPTKGALQAVDAA
ncbi:YebG family protein [Pantoea sp. 1.19]|uniref:YebG family protein n=1 Tax=Pantoea sp. 1.19 TaxID=1925589 RepID=UPI0009488C58|nr:YebG family protein [Pantoea sp. 1.19]